MPRNRGRRPHSPQTQIGDLAKLTNQELRRDSEILAARLGAELPIIDSVHVPTETYHDFIRRNWDNFVDGQGQIVPAPAEGEPQDPSLKPWRVVELKRVGPKQFWEESHRAFGLQPPKVTKELLGMGLLSSPTRQPVEHPAEKRARELQAELDKVKSAKTVQRIERDELGRVSRVIHEPSLN